jgi:hypothetical protein
MYRQSDKYAETSRLMWLKDDHATKWKTGSKFLYTLDRKLGSPRTGV